MNRRVLVFAAAVVVAVAVVGLSAAATMSARGDAPKQAKPKRVQQATTGGPASAGTQQQSPSDLERYWSNERMQGAKPIQKTAVGATRPSATVPSAPGQTAPSTRSAPRPKAVPKKTSSKSSRQQKSAAPSGGPSGQATDNGSAADHWTQDDMDKAEPVEKSPSGDAGSGSSSGLPGSGGGSTTPPPAVP